MKDFAKGGIVSAPANDNSDLIIAFVVIKALIKAGRDKFTEEQMQTLTDIDKILTEKVKGIPSKELRPIFPAGEMVLTKGRQLNISDMIKRIKGEYTFKTPNPHNHQPEDTLQYSGNL